MSTQYKVLLNGQEIGYSELEYGDPPMGVVFGKLIIPNVPNDYEFVRSYCLSNNIDFHDDTSIGFISTSKIPNLIVHLPSGEPIPNAEAFVDGGINELNINILQIPYPFYETAFQHHIDEYEARFK